MRSNLDAILKTVLRHEGGYTSLKADPGNWTGGKVGVGKLVGTNHGVAAPTLQAWRAQKRPGYQVTAEDMKNLSKTEAVNILVSQYWLPVKGDKLPSGLDLAVVDYAYNSGPAQAAMSLQRVVGTNRDGIIGNITIDAAKKRSLPALIDAYQDERLRFLKSLRTWKTFGKGWSNRVADIRREAKRMAGSAVRAQPMAMAAMQDDPKAPPAETPVLSTAAGKAGATALAGAVAVICSQIVELLDLVPPGQKWVPIAFGVVSAVGALAGIYVKMQTISEGEPQ